MPSILSFIKGPTLAEQWANSANRSSGFDYMRLVLAISIIILHSFEISYGQVPPEEIYANPWRIPAAMILPMFFALSGFLVAGSLERSPNLGTFVKLRALRIMPALAGEVMLCAFILGPIFTVLPLGDYFSNSMFYSYFWNIIGYVHYLLPGVFLNNPAPAFVNAQLWTIPHELECYFVLILIALAGFYRHRRRLILCAALLFVVIFQATDLNFHPRPWSVTGTTLLMSFISGVMMHRFRDIIRFNAAIFTCALIVSVFLLTHKELDAFVAIPLSYVTIYLGLLNPPRDKYLLSGDYSYGIYLYGWPMQQAVAALGPAFQHWYMSLLIALPCTILAAVMSWWGIERPMLAMKTRK